MYFKIALIVMGVISLINFFAYAIDKIKAKFSWWRIPEKTLLLTSFFGGAVGGSLAMMICRHKTKHWYFVAVNAIGLIWQVALVLYLFFMGF